MVAALDPDIDWIEGDIQGLPYGGGHHGAQAVVDEVFAQIPGTYDSFELEPQEWVDGGDTVVMLGRVTIRKDGREAASRVAQVWTLRDGRAVRFESFQDSQATAAYSGWTDRTAPGQGQALGLGLELVIGDLRAQLRGSALLGDAPSVEHHNAVGAADRAQAMVYDHRLPVSQQPREPALTRANSAARLHARGRDVVVEVEQVVRVVAAL